MHSKSRANGMSFLSNLLPLTTPEIDFPDEAIFTDTDLPTLPAPSDSSFTGKSLEGRVTVLCGKDSEFIGVLDHYRQKLSKEGESGLQNPFLREALAGLREEEKDLSSEDRYRNFTALLKKAVAFCTENPKKGDAEQVYAWCRHIFRPDLKETTTGKWVESLLKDYEGELDASSYCKHLEKNIPEEGILMKTARTLRRVSSSTPFFSWDPGEYSLRSLSFTEGNTDFLRMPCPVTGSNMFPNIDLLFIGYLRDLKAKGEKHFYINNQSRDPDCDNRNFAEAGLESKRVRKLEELAESKEFKGVFHVISLPRDSHFYAQKEDKNLTFTAFRQEYLGLITGNRQGFYIPDDLRDPEAFAKILDEVHGTYFSARTELSREERKDFIHLFDAHLSEYFLSRLQPESVNITCKDGVDRAVGSSLLLQALLLRKRGEKLAREDILYGAAWPAVLYHARAPKVHRHERFFNALARFINA